MKTNSQSKIFNLKSSIFNSQCKIVKGFTLIEIILAVFLLSVLMFSIYSVYALSLTSYEAGVEGLDVNSTSQYAMENIANYLTLATSVNVECKGTCIYFRGYFKSGDENKKYWLYLYQNDLKDKWWEKLNFEEDDNILFKKEYILKLQRKSVTSNFIYGPGTNLGKFIYFDYLKLPQEKIIYHPIFTEESLNGNTKVLIFFRVIKGNDKINLFTSIFPRNI